MRHLNTIEDVRQRFSELMAESYYCIHKRDAPNGIVVRTHINQLPSVLIPMLRSREIIKMKLDLYCMKIFLSSMITREL